MSVEDARKMKLKQDGPGCCIRHKPPYDCKKCGACCAGVYVGPSGVLRIAVTEEDQKRLPLSFRKHLVEYYDRRMMIQAVRRKGVYRCPALRGRIGRGTRCTIYNRRPFNCRYFEVGTSGCHAARYEYGLPIHSTELVLDRVRY